jgi:hypothetical protein
MHPPCQVVEVLAVSHSFESLIMALLGPSFRAALADSQPAASGMSLVLSLTRSADPTRPVVIGTMPAQNVADLLDKTALCECVHKSLHFADVVPFALSQAS